MSRNKFYVYGTRQDWLDWAKEIESVSKIKYVQIGWFDQPLIISFGKISEITGLGISKTGNYLTDDGCLVTSHEIEIQIEEIQGTNKKHYAVDSQFNSDSITVRLGGIFNKSGTNSIICGEISANSDFRNAIEIYKKFLTAIRKKTTKIETYLVGKNAYELFSESYRFTHDYKRDSKYDLVQ
jgi:hypothetical protein